MLKRSEVKKEDRWDLSHLYRDEADYEADMKAVFERADRFVSAYRGRLAELGADELAASWRDMDDLLRIAYDLSVYNGLAVSVDMNNPDLMRRAMINRSRLADLQSSLSFYESELATVDEKRLREAIQCEPRSRVFFEDHLALRPHRLSPESEQLLVDLNDPVLSLPNQLYEAAKFADLCFPDFECKGQVYPLSFAKYEETYAYATDTALRRKAFDVFSEALGHYRHTLATGYYAYVKGDVIMARKRGYESVFDYLLQSHKVDRTMHDRQIEIIMRELAPHMRRYAKKLGEQWNLDRVTYADLKLPPLPKMARPVSREEARTLVLSALDIMGDDYRAIAETAFTDGWMDFAENEGKSTGGFCAGSYKAHPYILLNWTGAMPDVFTMIHEIGHGIQGILASRHNPVTADSPTMYFIEAPSTFHELLLSDYLMRTSDDPQTNRLVAAQMVANTYYHNFVTHLLEADWQRKVYAETERGAALTADDFDRLFLETLRNFWGDAVEMTPGAERTWMRQPHYYSGLYSYTYSAGLTVGTAVSLRLKQEGSKAAEDWIRTLCLGGSLPPSELAREAGVDISTEKPLLDTIAYIGSLIDMI